MSDRRTRRDQIIDSTIELLATVGTAGTTFDRIVTAAGLSSKRLITYHFETREGLYGAVAEHVGALATSLISPDVISAPTWPEKLRAFMVGNVVFIGEHPAHIRALQSVIWAAPGEVDAIFTSTVSILQRIVTEGQLSGDFRRVDPLVAATSIRGAIDAAIHHLTGPLDARGYGEGLADLFLHALSNGAPARLHVPGAGTTAVEGRSSEED